MTCEVGPRKGRDETFVIRLVLAVFCFVAAGLCVWRAASGIAAIGGISRSSWDSILFIGGMPVAFAAGFAFGGFALMRRPSTTAVDSVSSREADQKSPVRLAWKFVATAVIAALPLFQNPPPGISWSRFAAQCVLPLLVGAVVGSLVAVVVIVAIRRAAVRRSSRVAPQRVTPDV